MSKGEMLSKTSYLEAVDRVIAEAVVPSAEEVDKTGAYPRGALDALGRAGLLGLINSPDVGGWGEAHRAATLVVERLATACASTAMVVCMHYAGTAVIEAHGPRKVREEIAAGRHVTTLGVSESGSRS